MSVLLTRYENTDFELNLAGLTAVLENYNGPEDPVALFGDVDGGGCGETAVINEAIYQDYQEELDCAQSSVNRPDGTLQQFEKGTMIWSGYTDAVYL